MLVLTPAGTAPPLLSRSDLRLTPAGLGDLVDFAQDYPHILAPTRVLELRERLRSGDRAFVQKRDGRPVRVAWVAQRPLPEVLQFDASEQISSGQSDSERNGDAPEFERALILYELWESPGSSQDETEALLDKLRREAGLLLLPLWIVCCQDSPLCEAAKQRGYASRFEIHRETRFGKVTRTTVSKISQSKII